MQIGVVLPNWIGDVAMATPTLRALRQFQGTSGRLVGVMRPHLAEVLAGTSWLDETVFFDRKSSNSAHHFWAAARKLRECNLDTIVLLTNSLSTAALAWFSRAKQRVGYVRHGRGLLLNRKLYPPRRGRQLLPTSAVEYYLKLAYSLGCPTESRRIELAVTPKDADAADRVWNQLKFTGGEPVVCLNTGGRYGQAKHWPAEYFVGLARRIVTELDARVLLICGPAEREAVRAIEHAAAHTRVRSLAAEKPCIGLSKACVARSQLLVTTDSGPRHFAAAFEVPVITLFGAKDPAWSETHFDQATHLRLDLPCSPCGQRTCPLEHHRCMRDLTVDKVFDVVRQKLPTHAPLAI